MISKKLILEDLKKNLTEKRFLHSLGVMETAVALARRYGVDEQKAELAGLIHDCAKDIPADRQLNLAIEFGILLDEISRVETALIHGPLGAVLARKKYSVEDPEILRAVSIHTTGDIKMSALDKVIFLADYIEPGRDFPGVEKLRKVSFEDLDEAVIMAFDSTIRYVLDNRGLLHPRTVDARNYLLMQRGKRGEGR
ncbi:bis(5'-nucleosyl)-tetraphosphatase (symmetrical) YqeK [Thermosediminibacter oceani]|uniref:bis(5'-nucleosyl)-tetraphosphatase (symmetrical) n=1 Tax=Thermosediminibacter oceani (strain ATCC BAA-1034 / DSM 16646 / JW/IW-1228P) TaxID=555079 RepID=D9S2A8_THEOJ|nr:bis(5'-nucleosyl)-tetraphosphatase (symmetrical) YqeK [Thermosediminibacter oceani]ADL07535.1 metal dependent phosphohydrolase [Thermosediminibacter oceani DSM 16646]